MGNANTIYIILSFFAEISGGEISHIGECSEVF